MAWAAYDDIVYALIPRILPKPLYIERDCDFGQLSSRPVECGYFYVTERRSENRGMTIRMPVAIFRNEDSVEHPDPVLLIGGGPGIAAFPMRLGTRQFWLGATGDHPWLEGRDLIVYDQRGAGQASPLLDCPGLKEGYTWLDDFRTNKAPNAAAATKRAVAECRDSLLAEGIDLTAYNTPALAADVADLRVALGIETWNLWGASYGSAVAMEVMRRHPEGIRSAILTGVLPPQARFYADRIENFAVLLERLSDRCESRSACSKSALALNQDLGEAGRRLHENPDTDFVKVKRIDELWQVDVDDRMLFHLIFLLLFEDERLANYPDLVEQLKEGSLHEFEDLINFLDFATMGPVMSVGMRMSVECNDWTETDAATVDQLAARYKALGNWIRWDSRPGWCAEWTTTEAPAIDPSPIKSDIPTLLLNGAYDTAMPAAWAERAAETLSRGQLFVFPASGHFLDSNPCAGLLIGEFLNDPVNRPVNPCFAREKPLVFN